MCFRITASGRTGRIKTKSTSSPSFLPPLLARQFLALLISSLLQATNFTQFLQGQYPKSHSYPEILPKTPRAQPTLDGDFFCLYVFVSHFRPRDALKKIFLFVYTMIIKIHLLLGGTAFGNTVLLGNMAANEKTKVTSEKGVFKSFSGRLLKFEQA